MSQRPPMARRLLPLSSAPPNPDLHAPVEAPGSQRRKRPNGILAVACLACQKRKTKCDGGRPKCRTCSSKNSDCVYDAPEGQTRIAALKTRNADLQARLSSSVNLLWSLKTLPPEEAAAVLDRIRSTPANDPAGILETLDPDGPALKRPRSDSTDALDSSSRDSSSSQSPPTKRLNSGQGPPDLQIHPGDPLHPRSGSDTPSPFSILESPVCREAFSIFLNRTGILFHIFTQDQGNAALDDVLRHGDTVVSKVSFCAVCALVATSSQYSGGRISTKDGDNFYKLARYFLDDVIEADPLKGMKICALLALYNIVIKSTVSLAFIEMGIGLGTSRGILQSNPPEGIEEADWLDYRRVWRTLLCCKGWLVATLGYASWNDWKENILASRDVYAEFSLQELIQMEMTRIAIIKAKIFQTTFVFSEMATDSINNIRTNLRRWYEELPSGMQLTQLAKPTLDAGARRGIYLVHCLHLGAMILVQRRIFQHYLPAQDSSPEMAQQVIHTLSDAIEEGFTASIQCARVLDLLLAEDGIFPRCWLCIFQSYISTAEIMFMTTQKLLHGYSSQQCMTDLSVATRSLNVLKYCAAYDHLAREFVQELQPHYDFLVSMTDDKDISIEKIYAFSPPKAAMITSSTLPWGLLLRLPPGDSKLHETSRDLLQLLCTPFANIKRIKGGDEYHGPLHLTEVPMPLTSPEEMTLGAHLEWTAEPEMSTPKDDSSDDVGQEIMTSLRKGYFVSSFEPCGWTSSGCSSQGCNSQTMVQ